MSAVVPTAASCRDEGWPPDRPAAGLLHVVGGQEDGLAEGAKVLDHPPSAATSRGVEPRGRLIEEEQVWVADDPEADVDAPLLAAGEPADPLIALLDEPDQLEDQVDLQRSRVEARVQAQGLGHRELGFELALLPDEPEPLPPRAGRVAGVDAEH